MQLSEGNIVEFQRLYKLRYGKEISRELALEQGIKLLRLMKRIYRPMTKDEYEEIQKYRTRNLPRVAAEVALREPDDSI